MDPTLLINCFLMARRRMDLAAKNYSDNMLSISEITPAMLNESKYRRELKALQADSKRYLATYRLYDDAMNKAGW